MKRRLLTILSAMSLLLLVAVVMIWVRSHWVVDQVEGGYWRFQPVTNQPPTANTRLERGKALEIVHFRGCWRIRKLDRLVRPKWPDGRHWAHHSHDVREVELFFRHDMGGKYGWYGMLAFGSVGTGELRLVVSDLLLALAASVMPALWTAGWIRRQKRIRSNRCLVCGYDLRATPDRCPECGAAPAKAPA